MVELLAVSSCAGVGRMARQLHFQVRGDLNYCQMNSVDHGEGCLYLEGSRTVEGKLAGVDDWAAAEVGAGRPRRTGWGWP